MRAHRRAPPRESAFLNVPYDAQYEDLLLAFLAGLSGFALTPRVTLEVPGSQRRLDRIVMRGPREACCMRSRTPS